MQYELAIENKKYVVEIGIMENGCVPVTVNGKVFQVDIENMTAPGAKPLAAPRPAAPASVGSAAKAAPPPTPPPVAPTPISPSAAVSGNGVVVCPIPGLILDIKVAVGDTVTAGQTVATMEAMKMENNIITPVAGKVKEVKVAKGATVAGGDVIMVIG